MFHILSQTPIRVPKNIPYASGGMMALTRYRHGFVYGRGVPENTLFKAFLQDNELQNPSLLVSCKTYDTTSTNKTVVGYEDPTFIVGSQNPFTKQGCDGLLATQTYPSERGPKKVDCDLVYFELIGGVLQSPTTLLTPQMLIEAGLTKTACLVKEGELLFANGQAYMLFEYNGSHGDELKASHIGICRIKDGRCTDLKPFCTAQADHSAHVSTCGAPIVLEKDHLLLFFNRRRDSQTRLVWGVTYMVFRIDRWDQIMILELGPDFLLEPPAGTTVADEDRSGAGQLINFGSCVTQLPDNTIEILSHVRDDQPYRTILQFA